jgi:8-oxo-dGTP pyrophosphatase MutT (NUDIX family)
MTDFFLREGRLDASDAVAALITVGDGNYLLQLRDQKAGIYYPGYWGLFGGAVDPGESPEQTLRRELEEELGLSVKTVQYFSEFTFDVPFISQKRFFRRFFEVPVETSMLDRLVLGEGADMRVFPAGDILTGPRVVPYDAYAIWLHATKGRIGNHQLALGDAP